MDFEEAVVFHSPLRPVSPAWVCESKHFSEGVAVDEFGEWTGFYRRRPFGIGSPIEQNRKHIADLADVFAKGLVRPPRRLGIAIKPQLRSLVLVSKEARIGRPKTKPARARVDGLDTVIKVDMLKSLIDKDLDSKGPTDLLRILRTDELERFGRELAALHRPAAVDWSARFGLPAEPPPAEPPPAPAISRVSDR